MPYDPLKHHRRSIRMRGYDYAGEGMYYVTLTTVDRCEIFSRVVGASIQLTRLGEIVREEWLRTPTLRAGVNLDEFVIMPDHLHGIIVILKERNGVNRWGEWQFAPTGTINDHVTPFRSPSRTLGAIIRGFKGASTKRINEDRGTTGARIWQRNYYEHIVRNEKDLDRIRRYIRNNPRRWSEKSP